MNMVNTTYNSTQDMINKVQHLKSKTKIKVYQNISNYYDGMNIRNFKFEEDPFSKSDQSFSKFSHEVLLLMKFLQTKPQVRNMKIIFSDLFYTVIENRDDNEFVNENYEDSETDYINFNDINSDHYIGRKNNYEILG